MKYRFNVPALRAIRDQGNMCCFLNRLIEDTGSIHIKTCDRVLDLINEVTYAADQLPEPDYSPFSKAAMDSLLGCIQPLTSLTPPCQVYLPNVARSSVIVAFWNNKNKPELIRQLINNSKATVDYFDQDSIDCLRSAMELARKKTELFDLSSNSFYIVPMAIDHIINAIKFA